MAVVVVKLALKFDLNSSLRREVFELIVNWFEVLLTDFAHYQIQNNIRQWLVETSSSR